jgi:hypothetical protein
MFGVTPVSQSAVTGSGAESDPYRVETVADVDGTSLRITEVTTYVVGDDFYRSDTTVSNTGSVAVDAVLFHSADCYLQGAPEGQSADVGYGFYDSSTGGIYCTRNPNNSPPGRVEGFVPVSPGSSYFEGNYSERETHPDGYPNTCDCNTELDNGAGLSWPMSVPAGGAETRSFLTTFSPTGQVFGFQEPPPPPPDPVVAAQSRPRTVDDLPAPSFAKSVNVQELSGQVFVGVRGVAAGAEGARASQKGVTFVPLSEARQIPIGSFLDTRRGKLRLQSARERRGTRQNGDFSQGLFQVLQSRRSRGLTDVVLKGASFASCRRPGRGKRASAAQSIRRRLRANARGRFRTRGRHSAATVRGTVWSMQDRCNGTLTRVTRGRVAVRDFRRRKTILLRAGKSYLARAPR